MASLSIVSYLTGSFFCLIYFLEESHRLKSCHVQVSWQTISAFHSNRNYEMCFSVLECENLSFCARGCFFMYFLTRNHI